MRSHHTGLGHKQELGHKQGNEASFGECHPIRFTLRIMSIFMSETENPGCLGFLFRLFGSKPEDTKGAPTFPYRVRDDFLSPAEASFYRVLLTALNGQALVCPKVGLSDIFFVTRPHENRIAFNRIAQKHVDFLVCDLTSLRPLFGIELDDASHARADRQERDRFVEQVFTAASLPLLRVPVQRGYSLQELSARIEPLLKGIAAPVVSLTPVRSELSPKTEKTSVTPLCLKCDVPMTLRTSTQGERAGQQFYGCPNYPKCRETRPL